MRKCGCLLIFITLCHGQPFTSISGDVNKVFSMDSMEVRTCPDYIDSCIYVCNDGSFNPCHPIDLFPISIDTSVSGESTEGSRYRIYFPWEHDGMTADKFTVTASWPCLSPTAVYASGNFAYWDIYGNDECPGTVQGSIWYGDDCEDEEGNIGSENCQELVGRFCFVSGDTLNWPENADQSVSTDICDACWMSAPAWSYYDSLTYSDSLLSPGTCEVFDHCHHSASDSILCGVGYLDNADTTSVNVREIGNLLADHFMSNYPNPFNPSTRITYSIPRDEYINITIYNLSGRKVRELFRGNQVSGKHSIDWDGKNDNGGSVSAGMYIYTLKTLGYFLKKKMIVLK